MTTMQTEWQLHEAAEQLVERLVETARTRSPEVAAFADELESGTSTRLPDWLDHIVAPVDPAELTAAGYVDGHRARPGVWRHPGAQLPAIVPAPDRGDRPEGVDGGAYVLALRVDDCAAFAAAHTSDRGVQGSPRSGMRRTVVAESSGVVVAGVERRSWVCGIEPERFTDAELGAAQRAWSLWAERPRTRGTAAEVAEVAVIARRMVELVGPDLAAAYALESERAYWQRRNTAAVLQHSRQDRFGLGWGNNDHHTFRSSREAFAPLMSVFGELGFAFREQFYAGAEAGWGAQVLEHPGNGGVLFADVDLLPEEVGVDLRTELPPTDVSRRLGTVGMWCALHGESILAAGMHHLEGQFDFDRLREDLSALGVGQMRPFSDFPHLRQAFTQAERWPVREDRLRGLVETGRLDQETAAKFAANGAPGSHLENLARRGGFKGFNQSNVSTTMRATDPRHYRP